MLAPDGTDAAIGTQGALVLTQPFPTLARTVWDDHPRYLSTYFRAHPGMYTTSDEAVVDRDGELWVLGRGDDVINVAAPRLSTMEIESVVAAQPGIADAAVIGAKDALKGTVPVAYVTLRAGTSTEEVLPGVFAAVDHAIGAIARLDRIYVCAALPKTRAGKTVRRLLREIAETGEARSDMTGLEDTAVVTTLIGEVAASRFGIRM